MGWRQSRKMTVSVALFAALAMVSVACSSRTTGQPSTLASPDAALEQQGLEVFEKGEVPKGAKVTKTGKVLNKKGEVIGVVDGSQAEKAALAKARKSGGGKRAVASGGGGGGGGNAPAAAANRNSYQGVTDKAIKMGFTWQHEECGNFFGPGLAAAFGVPQPEDRVAIEAALEYFQKYPEEFLSRIPGRVPAAVKANVTAKTGYWGRKIDPVLEDNGGPFCADKSRATVAKMDEQDKVFGSVQIPNDGSNYVMAEELAARKLLNIGAAGFRGRDYDRWSPFVYDITVNGSDVVRAWASWACRDLVGKKTFNTGDPTVSGKPRVLGLLHPDNEQYNGLAAEVKTLLKQGCNAQFKVEVAYPEDIVQSQQTADTAMTKMRSNGVTTIYMLTDILFPAFFTQSATKNQYYPEWAVSSVGFQDIAFVIRHLWEETQRKNAFGVSHLVASDRQTWYQTDTYKAWKKVRPNREPPGAWNNWFLNMEIFFMGVAGAGPNLTPETFAQGLAALCRPCARPSLKAQLIGFGGGDYTGVDDFTEIRFDPQKEDKYDPPDQYNGRPQRGYWNFPEQGLRYRGTVANPQR